MDIDQRCLVLAVRQRRSSSWPVRSGTQLQQFIEYITGEKKRVRGKKKNITKDTFDVVGTS